MFNSMECAESMERLHKGQMEIEEHDEELINPSIPDPTTRKSFRPILHVI
jgi:hypothetical protein